MTTQTFAILTTKDISALGKAKASGCAVLLYSALLSYSRNKQFCFPSIATLSERIGGAFSVRQIQRSLKFLEDTGFIKRNHKTSKQRFVMLRKALKSIGQKSQVALQGHKRLYNRRKKNTSFSKKKWQYKKNVSSSTFNSSKQVDNSSPPEAESIFSKWAIQSHDKDITTLSMEEITTIGRYLRSPDPEAIEWREIMWDYWKDTFLEIKGVTSLV